MKVSFCHFYSELHEIGQDSEKGCYGYLKQEQTLWNEVSCFLMKILLNMEIIASHSTIIPRLPPPPPPYPSSWLSSPLRIPRLLSSPLPPPPSSPASREQHHTMPMTTTTITNVITSTITSTITSIIASPYHYCHSYHHHPTRRTAQLRAKRLGKWGDFTKGSHRSKWSERFCLLFPHMRQGRDWSWPQTELSTSLSFGKADVTKQMHRKVACLTLNRAKSNSSKCAWRAEERSSCSQFQEVGRWWRPWRGEPEKAWQTGRVSFPLEAAHPLQAIDRSDFKP